MNSVQYPNAKYCVGIVEAWEEQGYLYICSELCERGNLNDYILSEMGRVKKTSSSDIPLQQVTFCTEESQDESKDDSDYGEMVTPTYGKESMVTPTYGKESMVTPTYGKEMITPTQHLENSGTYITPQYGNEESGGQNFTPIYNDEGG